MPWQRSHPLLRCNCRGTPTLHVLAPSPSFLAERWQQLRAMQVVKPDVALAFLPLRYRSRSEHILLAALVSYALLPTLTLFFPLTHFTTQTHRRTSGGGREGKRKYVTEREGEREQQFRRCTLVLSAAHTRVLGEDRGGRKRRRRRRREMKLEGGKEKREWDEGPEKRGMQKEGGKEEEERRRALAGMHVPLLSLRCTCLPSLHTQQRNRKTEARTLNVNISRRDSITPQALCTDMTQPKKTNTKKSERLWNFDNSKSSSSTSSRQIGLALLLLLHSSWHDDPAFPMAGRRQQGQDQALAKHKTLTAAPQTLWLACHIRLVHE